ncbi:hypothetical protein ACFXD5_41985 [Streptomyces sp. NPDC059385]|uniref:hypothetical protein n=1 Tax=Streptomyces sp. NPDC059385 TaxID=3346817 RepID=UPI00368626AC
MRARPSGVASLLVAAVVLTGFMMPAAPSRPGGDEPAAGPEAQAVVDLSDIAVEPPVQPARPPARELFGADCDTEISGSTVTARCHNGYPQTDLVRLHVECDRWWDLDGDSAPVPVGPAGRVELTSRCWKEVRSAWVTHQRS